MVSNLLFYDIFFCRREERRLEEDASQTESLKELKIPKTIFEKNTSPGLEKNL